MKNPVAQPHFKCSLAARSCWRLRTEHVHKKVLWVLVGPEPLRVMDGRGRSQGGAKTVKEAVLKVGRAAGQWGGGHLDKGRRIREME